MPLVVKCPVCRAEVSWEGNPHRPFCSERCRLIDLGAWAEGKYRIPGKKLDKEPHDRGEDDDDEEEPA
ncbi:MAG: DNA gyrase inhibitor YacG [Candidatus Binatia bacterium]